MKKLKEGYFAKRYIKVTFETECHIQNFKYEIINTTQNEIIFVVNIKHHKLEDILSYLETLGTVVDFQLESLPIECFVEPIY